MNTRLMMMGIAVLGVLVVGCAHRPAQVSAPASLQESASLEAIVVKADEVSYQSGETVLRGYLAYPTNLPGKRPSVLVAHEWWGLTDHVRDRARALAELGYVALAIDMYGEGKTADHPADAEKLMMSVMANGEEGKRRLDAGKAFLQQQPQTDPEKIAAIGYCMGGALSLSLARAGESLGLVGSFHGILSTQAPLQKGVFPGKILVFHGGSDPFVPEAQLTAFRKEMDDAGANYEVIVYPEAKHGFTNPSATELGERFQLPLAYDKEAAEDSWSRFVTQLADTWK